MGMLPDYEPINHFTGLLRLRMLPPHSGQRVTPPDLRSTVRALDTKIAPR